MYISKTKCLKVKFSKKKGIILPKQRDSLQSILLLYTNNLKNIANWITIIAIIVVWFVVDALCKISSRCTLQSAFMYILGFLLHYLHLD